MKPINILFIFIIFFSKIPLIKSSECSNEKKLNIGLLKNEFIDYEPYLYYELGNFASNTGTSYNIEILENNNDNFDIIFGEYYDLKKFQNQNLKFNDEILNFYKINNIQLSGNILPLDLDTFIILSKENQRKITLDEFSNFYSPIQYTLGISLLPKVQLIKLINYNLRVSSIENSDLNLEYLLNLYSNTYQNLNKNIIESNFLELFESFENHENTFTLFSDGILMYKNINYEYFQLFPHTKYLWNNNEGFFKLATLESPISFFGFSAYINNQENLGFICHLISKNIRLNTFRNFNLQIGPLSEKEVEETKSNIPNDYKEILINKNKNIYEVDDYGIERYEQYIQIIFNKMDFNELIKTEDYLN